MKRTGFLCAVLAAGLLSFGSAGAQEAQGRERHDGAEAPSIPPEVQGWEADWALPNHDYGNTRRTEAATITSANVSTLTAAWQVDILGSDAFGGAVTNPLIVGDTVYFQDGLANTYALGLSDGGRKWLYKPKAKLILGPNGPAVGYGKVFVPAGVYDVTALEAGTGDVLWSTTVSKVPTTGVDIQPLVYDGLVYLATVPGIGDLEYAGGGIGTIYALEHSSGEIAWSAPTVDSPALWGNPKVNSGGGCWYPPAVDLETGLMFWGTGNPAPFAGTPEYPNGSSRPGPNLYTNSLLALDHRTGAMSWFAQVYPHGLFDYDFQISPILASARIAGVERPVVFGAGKMGRVYAFDRASGAILWVCVVGRHENDQLAVLPPGKTTVYPGDIGGVETPMAYADGLLFAVYNDLPTTWSPESYFGGDNTPYIPPYQKGSSGLVAIEADTGKIRWEHRFPVVNNAAATVVNDLVFTATMDGTIYALERTSGNVLWQYKAPGGIAAWPAVAGDTLVWPCGGGFGFGGKPVLLALRVSP
jgi:glucose dehydrogenase